MFAKKGNTLILLVIVVVLTIAGLMYFNSLNKTSSNTQQDKKVTINSTEKTKIFKSSSALRFSIELPFDYQAEERFGSVIIFTPNGSIFINRNGTNFDRLEDYLSDLSIKNHFVLINKNNSQVNGLETISGNIEKEKIYFIYKDYAVYSLSAKDKSLYNDLDQIAKLFHYAP